MPANSLTAILLFIVAIPAASNSQEEQKRIDALVKKLTSSESAIRSSAVKELAQSGELAIHPVTELLTERKQSLETVARSGEVLVKIAEAMESDPDVCQEMMVAIKKISNTKDPKLIGIAQRLKRCFPLAFPPTAKDALTMLRSAGCQVDSESVIPQIDLVKDFAGTPLTLKYASAFKDGLRINMELSLDCSYYKVLPDLNLKELKIYSSTREPVRIMEDQIVDKLEELAQCTSLQTLELVFKGFPNKQLKLVRNLTNLTVLQLPDSTTDAELKHVAELEQLSRLEIINGRSIQGFGYSYLKKNKNLKTLNLYTCISQDKALKSLGELTQLTSLTLPQHSTNDTLRSIAGLKNLRSLNISNTSISDDGLKHLRNLDSLYHLALGESPITGECIPHLNAIPNLDTALLHSTLITEREAEKIRVKTTNSEFPFRPKSNEQMRLIRSLIQRGVIVQHNPFKGAQLRVLINADLIDKEFSDFSRIAELELAALRIDFPLLPYQARALSKLDRKTTVYLIGTQLTDQATDILTAHFERVVDIRSPKK